MNSDQQYKVVFQLSSNDTFIQKNIVRQLNNLFDEMQGIRIEVVAHGYGVDLLLAGSAFQENVEKLRDKGIAFLVCEKTVRREKLDPASLLSTRMVPGGIAHIIRRQSEGWSYIKSGY